MDMKIASLTDSKGVISYFKVVADSKQGGVRVFTFDSAPLPKDAAAFAKFINPAWNGTQIPGGPKQNVTLYGIQLVEKSLSIDVTGIGQWSNCTGNYFKQKSTAELFVDGNASNGKQTFTKVVEVSKAVFNSKISKNHLVAFAQYPNSEWNGKVSAGGQKQFITLYGKQTSTVTAGGTVILN